MRIERQPYWRGENAPTLWCGILATIFGTLAYGFGLQGVAATPLVIPVATLIGYLVGKAIGFVLLGTSGRAAESIYMPHAKGTWSSSHSDVDAMQARGDYAGAARAWEAIALAEPANPWPLIRAAELHERALAAPDRALEFFRRARDLPGIRPEQHRYVSQKMIDLHLGPLHDTGRALVELRRLIDQHPGTREAQGARLALERLKKPPTPP